MQILAEKNILVVGPGSLGSYFAARLGQKFRRLWVLDYRPARAQELQDRGFHVTGASDLDWIPPEGHVSADTAGWPKMDVVFFMVKAPALRAAAVKAASAAGPQTCAVCLQNGWDVENFLPKKWPPRRVVRGFTQEAAALELAGRVIHSGAGSTVLDAKNPAAKLVYQVLNAAGFRARLEKNFERERWLKLIVNACVNPIGALADVPNGRLLEPPLSDLVDLALQECARLSAVLKHRVSPAEARRRVRQALEATASNRNSMGQDLVRGRPTERGVILGPFLEAARKKRLEAPTLAALDGLLKRVEVSRT